MALRLDLSHRNIRVLEEEHVSKYNGKVIVDLTGNPLHFIPNWLAKYACKLIVDQNPLHFEKGFSKDVVVTVVGIERSPENMPDNLPIQQVEGYKKFIMNLEWITTQGN